MQNYRWKILVIGYFLVGLVGQYVQAIESKNQILDKTSRVFQISTIQALLKGVYDGETTFEQLKKFGDFGFGTFNGLDGEMIALNGQFYQAKADGTVHQVPDTMKTPYATVHFFSTDQRITLKNPIKSYQQLQNDLDPYLSTRNRPYALKIKGTFADLKIRSVPKQSKPYPPMVEVVAHQPIFEFQEIRGTLIGYWFPDYFDKFNVPGYHLHFLSEGKQHGGHLLDCYLSEATVEINLIDSVHFLIPQNADFQQADLTTYSRKELVRTSGRLEQVEEKHY